MDTDKALLQMLEEAGDKIEPSVSLKNGIPKQRMPGWIRWPVRCVVLPFILLDLSMQKLARTFIKPPFVRQGKCLQRGNCCRYILLPQHKGILGKLFVLWSTEILGFYKRSEETYISEGKKVWVMGCRYLKKDGRCAHYSLRPMVCRKWPLIEYFGYPRILKGCGFRAIERDQKER